MPPLPPDVQGDPGFPYHRSVLPNGLRVLSATMPATRSAAVNVYVGAGSRYERDEQAGISHLLEHLLFKGTTRRPTAPEISGPIEGVGGSINASTDRELTVYYAKVAAPHFAMAADTLQDIVRDPLMAAEEIEKERKVVIEELASVEDSPSQLVDLYLDQTMWPGQPLGRDIAGTPASVAALTRDCIVDYLRGQYVPNNTVVAVAGAVSHEEVLDAVASALGDVPSGAPAGLIPAVVDRPDGRLRLHYKKTEQTHIELGVYGLANEDPDRFALDLINIVLGDGMSSRLFVELREKRALCYDVHSYASHYRDAGAFAVYAAVDPQNGVEAVESLIAELAKVRDEGVTDAELAKAKELSKGRLLLRMEDTRAVAGWLGGHEILTGRVRTPDEIIALTDAVTHADVRRVAARLLAPGRLTLSVVGPYRSERRFAPLIEAA